MSLAIIPLKYYNSITPLLLAIMFSVLGSNILRNDLKAIFKNFLLK